LTTTKPELVVETGTVSAVSAPYGLLKHSGVTAAAKIITCEFDPVVLLPKRKARIAESWTLRLD